MDIDVDLVGVGVECVEIVLLVVLQGGFVGKVV